MTDYPAPIPGLVIRYSYLWKREAEQGQVEGQKQRPCAIVVCVEQNAGERIVTVAPIAHRRPTNAAQAIELTAATRRRLGLGHRPNWIMATEVNSFCWPGPDIRPNAKGAYAYGELPAVAFQALVRKILAASASTVDRSE